MIEWGNNVCLMLNFCLRDSFIGLFHCNRHFSIKGKTSVTFPNFPSPRVMKFLELLSIFTVSVPLESLGMSLLLPQHYLKNWLTLFYFSSANKVIFLFLVPFDSTSFSSAFFFICLISRLFRLFRASLWRLLAANNKNLFKGGGSITVSVFPFS